MKGIGFSTIILGFVLITLIVSVFLMAFTMYKLSVAPEYVIDSDDVVTTEGLSAKKFWDESKPMLVIPTVSNILAMILIGVFVVTG